MLLALPALLIVGGVYLYPALLMALYSFSSIDKATFSIESIIGLRNYLTVVNGANFGEVVLRTVYFAGGVALFTSLLAFPIFAVLGGILPTLMMSSEPVREAVVLEQGPQAEGLALDNAGNLYVVSERNLFFAFQREVSAP